MTSIESTRVLKGITGWPISERPREKLLQHGASSLSDAELLAIFIRTGTTGRTAVDIARELLTRFGSLRGLLKAEYGDLEQIAGLGPAKCAQLKAVLELGQRYLGESIQIGDPIGDPESVRRYLSARLRDLPYEVFCCLYLDNRHRVLAFEQLFRGTINGAAVYPREVVKQALSRNAAAVILVHNHPSGVAEPSRADEQLTRRIQEALDLVDIRVLDHLVVGDGQMTSFCERGLL